VFSVAERGGGGNRPAKKNEITPMKSRLNEITLMKSRQ
jgi:hypothetical protein